LKVFLPLTPIADLDLPATTSSATPDREIEATPRSERTDLVVDVVTAPDLVLPDTRGTIGLMETIETTGTTGIETAIIETIERAVITATATTGIAEEADPENAVPAEVGVREVMVEGE
jgi:hypothetical protein